jgi:hypothetical protein
VDEVPERQRLRLATAIGRRGDEIADALSDVGVEMHRRELSVPAPIAMLFQMLPDPPDVPDGNDVDTFEIGGRVVAAVPRRRPVWREDPQ